MDLCPPLIGPNLSFFSSFYLGERKKSFWPEVPLKGKKKKSHFWCQRNGHIWSGKIQKTGCKNVLDTQESKMSTQLQFTFVIVRFVLYFTPISWT